MAYNNEPLITNDTLKAKRRKELFLVEKQKFVNGFRYANLQVGDNDLIGNKFNGHDLHLLLQKEGIRSTHFVLNKESQDTNTYQIETAPNKNYVDEIINRKEFFLSDIVHLHLIHNTNFDVNLLPFFTSLVPTVITLHDPFFLGGHCIYHKECKKYLKHCIDCPYLDAPFVIPYDDTASRFEKKRLAIQNSDLSAIVASAWMEEKAKASPVFEGKTIYRLPFGVNQDIFNPGDANKARKELGIAKDAFVIFFRADRNPFKGLEIILDALDKIKSKSSISILTVSETGLLEKYSSKYDIHEFGWLRDDQLLAKLYQACDIFLMPSKQEAFGMMAIEAMNCGKPVLAINGTSLPSVIDSPRCGLAVNEDEFARTLQRWIDKPQELCDRAEKSYAFAKENYGISHYINGMLCIYQDVMERFASRHPHSTYVLSQLNWNSLNLPQLRNNDNASGTEAVVIDKKTATSLPQNIDLPKVSIIIPVYNGSNYLHKAIDSALAQTYSNIEIIVVNDGSSDHGQTDLIAKSFGNRIRYFYQENGGTGSALNCALEHVTGEYVSWLSHDDLYLPEKIEKQVIAILNEKKPAICACNTAIINEHGSITAHNTIAKRATISPKAFLAFDHDSGLNGCSLLIPKKAFDEFGGFDTTKKCTQDYYLWRKLFQKYSLMLIPDELVYYRRHSEQSGRVMVEQAIWEADILHMELVKELSIDELLRFTNNDSTYYEQCYQIYFDSGFYRTASAIACMLYKLYSAQGREADAQKQLAKMILDDRNVFDTKTQESIMRIRTLIATAGKKPRIVQYSNVWNFGGMERVINSFFYEMNEEYDCVLISHKEKKDGYPLPPNVTHITIENSQLPLASVLLRLSMLISADVLICNPNIYTQVLDVYPLFRNTGIPTVCANHAAFTLAYQQPYLHQTVPMRIKNYQDATLVTWVSPYSAYVYNQTTKANAIAIPNANSFVPELNVDWKRDTNIVLAVGRFQDELKRLDQIIYAFALAQKKCPDAELYLVGPYDTDTAWTPNGPSLLGIMDKLNIRRDSIHFLGEQADVVPFYRKAAMLVFPSESEGFGMVLTEAAAFGVPSIITSFFGGNYIIHDGVNGYVVAMDDIQALAERIVTLLTDKPLRIRMGQQAQELCKRFSNRAVFKQWKHAVDMLLAGCDGVQIAQSMDNEFKLSPQEEALASTAALRQICTFYARDIEAYRAQLEQLRAMQPQSHVETFLTHSTSWRITKPIRAILHARRQKKAKQSTIHKAYAEYMHNPEMDVRTNEIILNSNCWKITAPLRVPKRLLKKLLNR